MDSEEFANLLMSKDRTEWQDPEEILDQFKIKEGSCVADLGCGPGFFTLPLSKRLGRDGKIFAVDTDAIMLRHLNENLRNTLFEKPKIETIEADVSNSGIPDGCTDLVLFANLLHDLDDPKVFLKEVDRMLKEGGKVLDIDWHKSDTNNLGPHVNMRLSENESRNLLRTNGFRIINALNAGPYHYGFVCQKSEQP